MDEERSLFTGMVTFGQCTHVFRPFWSLGLLRGYTATSPLAWHRIFVGGLPQSHDAGADSLLGGCTRSALLALRLALPSSRSDGFWLLVREFSGPDDSMARRPLSLGAWRQNGCLHGYRAGLEECGGRRSSPPDRDSRSPFVSCVVQKT